MSQLRGVSSSTGGRGVVFIRGAEGVPHYITGVNNYPHPNGGESSYSPGLVAIASAATLIIVSVWFHNRSALSTYDKDVPHRIWQ